MAIEPAGGGQQEQRHRKEIKEGRNKDLSCILHKERITDCILFRGWAVTTNGFGQHGIYVNTPSNKKD
jgi:hypothetical protein